MSRSYRGSHAPSTVSSKYSSYPDRTAPYSVSGQATTSQQAPAMNPVPERQMMRINVPTVNAGHTPGVCYICSYMKENKEFVKIYHRHFSSIRLREMLCVEGTEKSYLCPSCVSRHKSYPEERVKIVVSDSTLHQFFAPPNNEDKPAYMGDTMLTDYITIPGGCIEVGNCYQRIVIFIVQRLSANHDEGNKKDYSCDGDIFLRKNFDKFNFPAENKGSFTVRVEDNLAKFWHDSLEWQYGKPMIVKTPNGTESDRYWKVRFGQDEQNIELTVHFYNHNKYKDKKQSKLMILGSTMCEYVFTELPNIYKIVL